MARILVVDDEEAILRFLKTLLTRKGYEVECARGGPQALTALREGSYDLMITDYVMEPMDGLELLKRSSEEFPGMPTVMISGYCTVSNAVEVLKAGAFDYLPKPVKVEELMAVVQRALAYEDSAEESFPRFTQQQLKYELPGIVAYSAAMRRVCEQARRLIPVATPVLLMGEAGTGKELVARTLHAESARKEERFVAVDCSLRPEEALYERLYGAAQGAGSKSKKAGAIEQAKGGTLYLNEIGSLPIHFQERFLKILVARRSGSSSGVEDAHADVRILASSKVPLQAMVDKGNFSANLYDRLRPFSIHIPPLRERAEDIVPIACHAVRECVQEDEKAPEFDADAQLTLKHYPWPGNADQLVDAVREAYHAHPGELIGIEQLPKAIIGSVDLTRLKEKYKLEKVDYKGQTLKKFLRGKEKEYLSAALSSGEGDEEQPPLEVDDKILKRHVPGDGDPPFTRR